ncbi:Hypothetical protein PBC10988_12930 [Planctomycetales bacterium 10988]|nr:Hypothetical protein PBC10988_12930 [Planctomycetales bacterium 10988]
MNTLKTMFAILALAGAAYAVYVTIATPEGKSLSLASLFSQNASTMEEEVAEAEETFPLLVDSPLSNPFRKAPAQTSGTELPSPFEKKNINSPEIAPSVEDPAATKIPQEKLATEFTNPFFETEVESGASIGDPTGESIFPDGAQLTKTEPPPAVQASIYGQGSAISEEGPIRRAGLVREDTTLMEGNDQQQVTEINSQWDPQSLADFQAAEAEVGRHLQMGRFHEALRSLSAWYPWEGESRLPAEKQREIEAILSQLAGTVLYSRRHLLEPPYQVQPADSLEQIAQRYQVSWQILAKINGIADPNQLRPGDQLKVLPGPFDAYLDLSNYRLSLKLGDLYAGQFQVGFGRDQQLQAGTRVVQLKMLQPTYYGASGILGPDHPENPLAGYWIDLGAHLGLHATQDETLIGEHRGQGCVRLKSQEMRDLFDILTVGSKVVLVGEVPAEEPANVAERSSSPSYLGPR